MTTHYTLNAWTNPRNPDDVRIYIGGTTRDKIFFRQNSRFPGRVFWSSKTNDTPAKFRSGDHYGKIKKDANAVEAVAHAFSITLGEGGSETEWQRALQLAADGIQIEA